MPCSPQSSTGCCTCHAKGRRNEHTLGPLPQPLCSPRAPRHQQSRERSGTGGEGELTSVTLTLQLDQVSSAPIMLSVCSREGYGSLVLRGIQVNSSARRFKSLHYLAPMSPAQRAPTDPCPLAQIALPPPGPSNPKFTSWLPSEGLSLDGEPAGRGEAPISLSIKQGRRR